MCVTSNSVCYIKQQRRNEDFFPWVCDWTKADGKFHGQGSYRWTICSCCFLVKTNLSHWFQLDFAMYYKYGVFSVCLFLTYFRKKCKRFKQGICFVGLTLGRRAIHFTHVCGVLWWIHFLPWHLFYIYIYIYIYVMFGHFVNSLHRSLFSCPLRLMSKVC